MAAARINQLEEKIARYERIMSGCPRCKAAMGSNVIEYETPSSSPPPSTSLFQRSASEVSSSASAISSEDSASTSGYNHTTRSSKQNESTSQSIPLSKTTNVVGLAYPKHLVSNRSGRTATGPKLGSVTPSSGLSKPTTVEGAPYSLGSSSTQQTYTNNSLDIRPTSLRPKSHASNTLSADTNPRKINEGSLLSSGNKARKPRGDLTKQADWVVAARKMLGEIPLGWVWHARVLGLDKSMLAAVTKDSAATPDDTIGGVDETHDGNRLLRLVRDFAHRHSDKRMNFQHFLLVCLCNVLSAQNIPQSSIVEALQICISDTGERNIDRYLKGAKLANEIIDRLFFRGWRYRAIDLLLLCMCDGIGLQLSC